LNRLVAGFQCSVCSVVDHSNNPTILAGFSVRSRLNRRPLEHSLRSLLPWLAHDGRGRSAPLQDRSLARLRLIRQLDRVHGAPHRLLDHVGIDIGRGGHLGVT